MLKFEDAYCSSIKHIVDIEIVSDTFITDNTKYVELYKGKLYCPECLRASLLFVNAKTPHFRTAPDSIHAADCTYMQGVMTEAQTKRFLSDRSNLNSIERQMDHAIIMLLSPKEQQLYVSTEKDAQATDNIESVRYQHDVKSLQIPRKRIDLPFRECDFGINKLFYGIVDFTWEKNQSQEGYKILLRHITKKRLLCKIAISEKVYNHIPFKYQMSQRSQFRCLIAFIANFKKNTSKSYQQTYLRTSDYLKIQFL